MAPSQDDGSAHRAVLAERSPVFFPYENQCGGAQFHCSLSLSAVPGTRGCISVTQEVALKVEGA